MQKSLIYKGHKAGALRLATLASVFAIAVATVTAAPLDIDNHGVAIKLAYAGGNGGGNGNAGGNGNSADAPGQQKQIAGDGAAGDDAAVSEVTDGVASQGKDPEQQALIPIAEDAEPATQKVIKELAGLPDKSALTDQQESEAIKNGWGTWRTADGPETVIAR